jgi:hypothetical protein
VLYIHSFVLGSVGSVREHTTAHKKHSRTPPGPPWALLHCVTRPVFSLLQFRHVPGNVFSAKLGKEFDRNTNELVIRIQPEEAIYMKINNKVPGLGLQVQTTRLDLQYREDLDVQTLPDAYERLLLDVVNGAAPSASLPVVRA